MDKAKVMQTNKQILEESKTLAIQFCNLTRYLAYCKTNFSRLTGSTANEDARSSPGRGAALDSAGAAGKGSLRNGKNGAANSAKSLSEIVVTEGRSSGGDDC